MRTKTLFLAWLMVALGVVPVLPAQTNPPVEEDQILKIQLAFIESCENAPGCMALNSEKLLSGVPVTYPVATTWEEYQKTFHSMQEVSEAIAAQEKARAQSGEH